MLLKGLRLILRLIDLIKGILVVSQRAFKYIYISKRSKTIFYA